MKRTGFTRKPTVPLKRSGFKSNTTSLKRSSFKKKIPDTPQALLDGIVSKVVRLNFANEFGLVQCATCQTVLHWTNMQCGHFQPRQHVSTRYDMKNLAPQCEDCNCYNQGRIELFAEFIDTRYGTGTAEMLKTQARHICHDFPYEQEIMKWSAVLEQLTMSKNREIEY